MKRKKLNSIELFTGGGGLALGLEKAGFNNLLCIEKDKASCETLRENRPLWNVINKDIEKVIESGIKKELSLDKLENKEIDLISGGFPCQPFSYAGKGLGIEDTRGTLFYSFAKAVSEIKPKIFLAENVKGLINHDNGKTLKTILDTFEKENYMVQYKLLNAIDYSVAQKRQRIFIVGIRKDIYLKNKIPFKYPTPHIKKLNLKDVLQDVPLSKGAKYSEKKEALFKLIPMGGWWKDLDEELAREYMKKAFSSKGGTTGLLRRLSWEEPCLTILTSPSQKITERCHPIENRPLTIRESARIQSFPDDWVFKGSISAQYKQIGNAVPVNMGIEIGKSIFNYLSKVNHLS